MTTESQLIARLRGECRLPLPEGTRLERTRAGRIQRSQGAWSWFAVFPCGQRVTWKGRGLQLGSHSPMTVLLNAARLVVSDTDWGDTEIDPADMVWRGVRDGRPIVVAMFPPGGAASWQWHNPSRRFAGRANRLGSYRSPEDLEATWQQAWQLVRQPPNGAGQQPTASPSPAEASRAAVTAVGSRRRGPRRPDPDPGLEAGL